MKRRRNPQRTSPVRLAAKPSQDGDALAAGAVAAASLAPDATTTADTLPCSTAQRDVQTRGDVKRRTYKQLQFWITKQVQREKLG